MYTRRGVVIVHFLPQSQLSGNQRGTGKFIYEALILDNKQHLSNMIDHEATQVPYIIKTAFLADSYIYCIFCWNFPAILYIIAIAIYIATYMKAALLSKKSK